MVNDKQNMVAYDILMTQRHGWSPGGGSWQKADIIIRGLQHLRVKSVS